MFFGDEHLGKAVAVLRDERKGLNQKRLALEIGVKPNTMSLYESGSRGMSAEQIRRIANVLGIEPVEIWDEAYGIFRYNLLSEGAEREGVPMEALIARGRVRPSLGQILDLFDSLAVKARQLLDAALQFLDPERRGSSGIPMRPIKVHPPRKAGSKTKKAVRFSRPS